MRFEALERELRAQRPEVDQDFARRLDEWAAAGFPRDRGLGPGVQRRAGAARRLWDRLTAVPPRQIALPVGAVATVAVIAGVVISNNGSDTGRGLSLEGESPTTTAAAPSAQDAGSAAQAESTPPSGGSGAGAASEAAPDASQGFQLDAPAPSAADTARAGTQERIVDATARLTLGADAEDVQQVANGIVSVTDRYDGVVSDSQVTSDRGGARASFTLEIPYKSLDAALADLSDLADVVSRTEGTEDITARAVKDQRELANTLDRIREARIELIQADTREEKLVIRSQLQSLQATADAQQAALDGVKRQGRFATVNVEVNSAAQDHADDGGWSLGDALDDAGRVLEVIGGVAVVSLAILVPLGLIAALVAWVVLRSRRRARERALDS